jgi:hypothetical protein
MDEQKTDNRAVMATIAEIRRFVLADQSKRPGSAAIFTLEGASRHFTYRVKQAHDKRGEPIPCWNVKVLAGGSVGNNPKWVYVGSLRSRNRPYFAATKNSPGGQSFQSFNWFTVRYLSRRKPHSSLTFWHEGRCAACGQPLTRPESIKRGFGPHCWAARS